MKCRLVNNAFCFLPVALFYCAAFPAAAEIEYTEIAQYDLAGSGNTHYGLAIEQENQHIMLTVSPLDKKNLAPTLSFFKFISCTSKGDARARKGILQFISSSSDKNDPRLTRFSRFVDENNLRAWSLPLERRRHLLFLDESAGMLITDGTPLLSDAVRCPSS